MKLIKLNFSQSNESVESWDDRIKNFLKFASLLSGIAHFGFIFLFMYAGVKEMMYFNAFISVPLIITCYILGQNQKMFVAFLLFYFEVAFHAVAAIYYTGFASGFQFYLLNAVVLVHLAYGWRESIRWFIFFFYLFLYIISFIYLRFDPIYYLNKTLLDILYIFNIIVFTSIASLYLYYFMNLIVVFEKKIKQAFHRLNQKNQLINEQKDEIESQRDNLATQKEEIEQIHLEVTDSINYATRIQKSILPSIESLHENIKGLFVLYKPKHNVSGDFYWWTNIENHTVVTAADCTGHGVPGAFMSMLGISYLREIVMKEYITHPGVILRKLRKEIVKSLKQKGESGEQKDGMDLGLVSINHENNLAQFAGANNPVYIVTNQIFLEENKDIIDASVTKVFESENVPINPHKPLLIEIKPDKMPIGIYQKMDNFTMHEIQLKEGDTVYLFSDGFADQFGGPKGKKYKYCQFKKILLENSHKPMFEQKEMLDKAFNDWKGEFEQIDDVVVLGIKI